MRRYETIVISNPDLSDEDREALFGRTKDLISQGGGFLVIFDPWEVKKLAYEIRKKIRGHYLRLDFCGTGPLVSEIERSFRIDDRVLKYMTVLLEENADVESLKAQQIAEAELKEKESAKTASDAPESRPGNDAPDADKAFEPEAEADEVTQTEDEDKEEGV